MPKINTRDFFTLFIFLFSGILLISPYFSSYSYLPGTLIGAGASYICFFLHRAAVRKVLSPIYFVLLLAASAFLLDIYMDSVTNISNIYSEKNLLSVIALLILLVSAYGAQKGKFTVCRISNVFIYIMPILFLMTIMPVFYHEREYALKIGTEIIYPILVFADTYVILDILDNKDKNFNLTFLFAILGTALLMIIKNMSDMYLFSEELYAITNYHDSVKIRLLKSASLPEIHIILISLALSVKLFSYFAFLKKYSKRFFPLCVALVFIIFKAISL